MYGFSFFFLTVDIQFFYLKIKLFVNSILTEYLSILKSDDIYINYIGLARVGSIRVTLFRYSVLVNRYMVHFPINLMVYFLVVQTEAHSSQVDKNTKKRL